MKSFLRQPMNQNGLISSDVYFEHSMAVQRSKKQSAPRVTVLEVGLILAIILLIAGSVAIVLAS